MIRQRSLQAWVAAVLLIAGQASAQDDRPKPGFNLYSKDQDIQLGREAAAEIRKQVQVVSDPRLQEYVRRIGQHLTRSPEAGGYPYEFTLINDSSINAFALPGGPVFVNSGLVASADNEAQLAGAMAHEISHVALRHGTNQASKANVLSLPAAIAGAILGRSAAGQLGQLGVGLGANLVMLHYSRSAESQADELGARIMAEAGYNPIELARFFEKLQRQGGQGAPQFLSDHPNPGNRERDIERVIAGLPRRDYQEDSREFPEMRSLVRSLPAPAKRVRSAAYPSSNGSANFTEYRSSRYAFAYPEAWQVFGDGSSAGMVVAPREGLVEGRSGSTDVGYGAILSYFFPENGSSLREGTSELIHHLHASNPDMQVEGATREARVDGSAALITTLLTSSPYGGAERNYLVTVSRPEGLFYLIFVEPERARAQLTPVFREMVQSIRFHS